MVQLSHLYMTTGKTIALTTQTFVSNMMSLLLNMLPNFFPRSKCFVLFCFDFMVAVNTCSDFGAQENKICHCFHFPPIYLPWSDGTGSMTLVSSQLFHSPLSPPSRGSLAPLSSFSAIRVVSSAYLRLLIFLPLDSSLWFIQPGILHDVLCIPTPSDPMDCSLPGSSVHGIFQARVLEWVAVAF